MAARFFNYEWSIKSKVVVGSSLDTENTSNSSSSQSPVHARHNNKNMRECVDFSMQSMSEYALFWEYIQESQVISLMSIISWRESQRNILLTIQILTTILAHVPVVLKNKVGSLLFTQFEANETQVSAGHMSSHQKDTSNLNPLRISKSSLKLKNRNVDKIKPIGSSSDKVTERLKWFASCFNAIDVVETLLQSLRICAWRSESELAHTQRNTLLKCCSINRLCTTSIIDCEESCKQSTHQPVMTKTQMNNRLVGLRSRAKHKNVEINKNIGCATSLLQSSTLRFNTYSQSTAGKFPPGLCYEIQVPINTWSTNGLKNELKHDALHLRKMATLLLVQYTVPSHAEEEDKHHEKCKDSASPLFYWSIKGLETITSLLTSRKTSSTILPKHQPHYSDRLVQVGNFDVKKEYNFADMCDIWIQGCVNSQAKLHHHTTTTGQHAYLSLMFVTEAQFELLKSNCQSFKCQQKLIDAYQRQHTQRCVLSTLNNLMSCVTTKYAHHGDNISNKHPPQQQNVMKLHYHSYSNILRKRIVEEQDAAMVLVDLCSAPTDAQLLLDADMALLGLTTSNSMINNRLSIKIFALQLVSKLCCSGTSSSQFYHAPASCSERQKQGHVVGEHISSKVDVSISHRQHKFKSQYQSENTSNILQHHSSIDVRTMSAPLPSTNEMFNSYTEGNCKFQNKIYTDTVDALIAANFLTRAAQSINFWLQHIHCKRNSARTNSYLDSNDAANLLRLNLANVLFIICLSCSSQNKKKLVNEGVLDILVSLRKYYLYYDRNKQSNACIDLLVDIRKYVSRMLEREEFSCPLTKDEGCKCISVGTIIRNQGDVLTIAAMNACILETDHSTETYKSSNSFENSADDDKVGHCDCGGGSDNQYVGTQKLCLSSSLCLNLLSSGLEYSKARSQQWLKHNNKIVMFVDDYMPVVLKILLDNMLQRQTYAGASKFKYNERIPSLEKVLIFLDNLFDYLLTYCEYFHLKFDWKLGMHAQYSKNSGNAHVDAKSSFVLSSSEKYCFYKVCNISTSVASFQRQLALQGQSTRQLMRAYNVRKICFGILKFASLRDGSMSEDAIMTLYSTYFVHERGYKQFLQPIVLECVDQISEVARNKRNEEWDFGNPHSRPNQMLHMEHNSHKVLEIETSRVCAKNFNSLEVFLSVTANVSPEVMVLCAQIFERLSLWYQHQFWSKSQKEQFSSIGLTQQGIVADDYYCSTINVDAKRSLKTQPTHTSSASNGQIEYPLKTYDIEPIDKCMLELQMKAIAKRLVGWIYFLPMAHLRTSTSTSTINSHRGGYPFSRYTAAISSICAALTTICSVNDFYLKYVANQPGLFLHLATLLELQDDGNHTCTQASGGIYEQVSRIMKMLVTTFDKQVCVSKIKHINFSISKRLCAIASMQKLAPSARTEILSLLRSLFGISKPLMILNSQRHTHNTSILRMCAVEELMAMIKLVHIIRASCYDIVWHAVVELANRMELDMHPTASLRSWTMDKCGWLLRKKVSSQFRTHCWVRRWFVIRIPYLFEFLDNGSEQVTSQEQKILLAGCAVERILDADRQVIQLKKCNDNDACLVATDDTKTGGSSDYFHNWFNEICSAIVRANEMLRVRLNLSIISRPSENNVKTSPTTTKFNSGVTGSTISDLASICDIRIDGSVTQKLTSANVSNQFNHSRLLRRRPCLVERELDKSVSQNLAATGSSITSKGMAALTSTENMLLCKSHDAINQSQLLNVNDTSFASVQQFIKKGYAHHIIALVHTILQTKNLSIGNENIKRSEHDTEEYISAHIALQAARIIDTVIPHVAHEQKSTATTSRVHRLAEFCAFAAVRATAVFEPHEVLKVYKEREEYQSDRMYLLHALSIARAYVPRELLMIDRVNCLYPNLDKKEIVYTSTEIGSDTFRVHCATCNFHFSQFHHIPSLSTVNCSASYQSSINSNFPEIASSLSLSTASSTALAEHAEIMAGYLLPPCKCFDHQYKINTTCAHCASLFDSRNIKVPCSYCKRVCCRNCCSSAVVQIVRMKRYCNIAKEQEYGQDKDKGRNLEFGVDSTSAKCTNSNGMSSSQYGSNLPVPFNVCMHCYCVSKHIIFLDEHKFQRCHLGKQFKTIYVHNSTK